MLKRLKDKLKNPRIHSYKFVPPCPKCGSYCVGRYVKEPFREEDAKYMERESLKHGEIIRFCDRIPRDNFFCVDCDNEWHGLAETKWYTRDELENEIKRRDTRGAYYELMEEEAEEKDKKKTVMDRIQGRRRRDE